MADVNNVSGSSPLGQYDIGNKKDTNSKNEELGRNEFLELMITQLQNQNPLDPQDNAEFVAQLAQFSTVEGIENMSSSLEDMSASFTSSQALQATALVGGSVTVNGQDTSILQHGDLVYGLIEMPSGATNTTLRIKNAEGETVEDVNLGTLPSGAVTFKWDGANMEVNGVLVDIDYDKFETDEDGNIIPHDQGEYSFDVYASVGGVQEAIEINLSSRVDSVTLGSAGEIQLNLPGGNVITMDDVLQINSAY
ncbi:flagellar hook assembly protein FlgD [Saccharospirillum mangrovi]|uniref:flagellar hook assembly protein FlgD n=1 Tax=Saccharospirillum mangrovi TaxID=2161747 RepID=UPI000D387EDA|nr:flagellar hook assembly protein FlgD [Saccharospirillum mangrovi]